MLVFFSAYQLLETAASQLEGQDDALADEVRSTMDRLWSKLSQPERELLNKRKTVPSRLPGTISDAELWDAFAEELVQERRALVDTTLSEKGGIFIFEAIRLTEVAAKRVAARIRGDK